MPRFARTQAVSHSIGPNGRFDLKVTAGDVRVRGTSQEDASVRATYEIRAANDQEADAIFDRVKLVADAGDGRLRLEEPDGETSLRGFVDRLLRGGEGVSLSVEVSMPSSAELRLETVSGDVTVEQMLGEQRYTTVSGDLFVTDAGGDLRIKTISGDVTVRADRPLAARADTVSGDLSLAAPRLESLRTHSVSGDVEVEGELSPAGEFRVETVSGDVSVGLLGSATFEVRGLSTDISSDIDHRIEGRQDRRRVIVGSGNPTLLFNSMSGDLSIHAARRVRAAAPAEPSSPRPVPLTQDAQLEVLQALERGEIDVDEATRRLAGGGDDA